MFLSTSSLLLLYVTCETGRANYAYYAFHTFPQISASLITLFSEAFKLTIALISLINSENGIGVHKLIQSAQQGETDFKRTLKYAVPAALYLINNLIYYTVLPKTTPSLLQVCVLAKLPATGILHHFMIRPQRNIHAWICLLILCIGLIIFNVPSKPQDHQSPAEADSAWYLAPIAGLVIACFSALASISSETSIKKGNFWESQAYLYVWGIVFAIIAYPLMPTSGDAVVSESRGGFGLFGVEASILGLVVITATTGLVVAVVLRARDNILKLIGTAASLITVAASQYVLLPKLRASTFTPWRVCGGGVVAISTWCYNHYSQELWHPRNDTITIQETQEAEATSSTEEVPQNLSPESTGKSNEKDWLQPSPTKILVCAIAVAFVTMEVALMRD
jgi:UDP-sugar transporter A1/2/3